MIFVVFKHRAELLDDPTASTTATATATAEEKAEQRLQELQAAAAEANKVSV